MVIRSFFRLFLLSGFVFVAAVMPCYGVQRAVIAPAGRLPKVADWVKNIENCNTISRLRPFVNQALDKQGTEKGQFLAAIAYVQGKTLVRNLLTIIDFCDRQAAIWKKAKQSPLCYRIKRGPFHWFGKKGVKQEIDDYIMSLNGHRSMYVGLLGTLNTALHGVHNSFKKPKSLSDSLHHLLAVIEAVLTNKEGNFSKNKKPLASVIEDYISGIKGYGRRSLATMKSLSIPNHFQRNFMVYALGAVGAVAAGVYWWENPDKVFEWQQQGIAQFGRFYNNHVKNKIQRLGNIFWPTGDEESSIFMIKGLRDRLRNTELTLALLAALPFPVGGYYAYSWLRSKKKVYAKVKKVLIRIRAIIDRSSDETMTLENERQGMLIYTLHKLKKLTKSVPKKFSEQLQADILYLESACDDKDKIQRINDILGPYAFLA